MLRGDEAERGELQRKKKGCTTKMTRLKTRRIKVEERNKKRTLQVESETKPILIFIWAIDRCTGSP